MAEVPKGMAAAEAAEIQRRKMERDKAEAAQAEADEQAAKEAAEHKAATDARAKAGGVREVRVIRMYFDGAQRHRVGSLVTIEGELPSWAEEVKPPPPAPTPRRPGQV